LSMGPGCAFFLYVRHVALYSVVRACVWLDLMGLLMRIFFCFRLNECGLDESIERTCNAMELNGRWVLEVWQTDGWTFV